ncbi:MAG TPA: hypothetical protein VIF10_10140 [Methylobacter sp.]|jgi:hypothetical protein
MNIDEFKSGFNNLLGNIAENVVCEHRFFELPSNRKPWFQAVSKRRTAEIPSGYRAVLMSWRSL